MATTLEELEKAQNETTVTLRWVVGTLGRIEAKVDDLAERVTVVETDIAAIKADVGSLRRDLPSIVGDAVREAMGK